MFLMARMRMAEKKRLSRIDYRKKPQQDRSVQRVERILAAARHLIERHGVSGLKMTAIAKVAGVPIGSLYQYFPERAAIVKALFDQKAEVIEDKLRRSFKAVRSLDEALDAIEHVTDWYYDQLRENAADYQILIATEADRDLIKTNYEDSRQLGDLLYTSIMHLLPQDFPVDMRERSLLFSYMIGAVVRLALVTGEPEASRILSDWKALMRDMFFHVPVSTRF